MQNFAAATESLSVDCDTLDIFSCHLLVSHFKQLKAFSKCIRYMLDNNDDDDNSNNNDNNNNKEDF